MEAKLTGFDLLVFVNAGFAQYRFTEDGEYEVFVEDQLAEHLTEQTGIKVETEQLVNVYIKFAELLGGMEITITPNQEEEQ